MRSSARIVFRSSSSAISTKGYQTLFMPISVAAVSAAWPSAGGTAALKASTSGLLLAAKAAASATPIASSGARLERAMTPSRFRRMSFACSGMRSLMLFRKSIRLSFSSSKRRAADSPVAGAQLVGLQAVEDAQHFVRVAADVQVVDAHVLDRVVGVDDE